MTEVTALWSDSLALFDVQAIKAAGADPDAVYFAGLAYRQVWQIHWDIVRDELSFHGGERRGDYDAPGEWHLALVHAHNAVAENMVHRTVLADETGVLYTDAAGQPRVVWVFEELELPLPKSVAIQNVLTKETFLASEVLTGARHHVYTITPHE